MTLIICLQIWYKLWSRGTKEKCDPRVDGYVKSLAQRAQEESVSDERRENHVSYNYENDAHPGVYVVRERQKKTEKRE